MRDKIKPEGIMEVVENKIKYAELYKLDIEEAKDLDIRENLKLGLISISIQKIIALYSSGAEKEVVKTALLDAISIFEDYFKWEGVELSYGDYDYMVWMVSLSILCDIELVDFDRFTALLKRDQVKDALLDKLIKYKQINWEGESTNYIQNEPYAKTASLSSEKDLKNYLDKVWYQAHDEAYWHDMHKNKKANNYFGYWAWETAALAKINGINDDELKEHPFYPYDAVHW